MPVTDEQTAAILAAAEKVRAAGPGSPRLARDPVNLPAIRNWTDAIGDANPLYTDPEFAASSVHGQLVAPPAMVQVWTMPGLQPPPADGDADPLGQMMDGAGRGRVHLGGGDQLRRRHTTGTCGTASC